MNSTGVTVLPPQKMPFPPGDRVPFTVWQPFCLRCKGATQSRYFSKRLGDSFLPHIPSLPNSEAATLGRDSGLAITPAGENNHSNRRQAVNVSSPTARHNVPFSWVGAGVWDYSGEAESEWKPLNILLLSLSPLTFLPLFLSPFRSCVDFTFLPPFFCVSVPFCEAFCLSYQQLRPSVSMTDS